MCDYVGETPNCAEKSNIFQGVHSNSGIILTTEQLKLSSFFQEPCSYKTLKRKLNISQLTFFIFPNEEKHHNKGLFTFFDQMWFWVFS